MPQGFNYQAAVNDAAGNPVRNTDLQVKMSILSDTLAPVIEWEELHSAVRTNSNGVFSLVIGSGTRQTTSSAATFNAINWQAPQLFLRSQVYYQGSWKSMGSARLWTVPYSMVAGELSGKLDKLAVEGSTTSMEEALFEVKNKDGQTIFAVFNEGVRIYVDDGDKGVKGGFAIGGFGTVKEPSQDLFVVGIDSIRAYIDPTPGKAVKGGFAIGGFGTVKPESQKLLYVDADSIRAYINPASGKGVKGGFAIGGFGTNKGVEEYLRVTRDSTRINVNGYAKTTNGGFAIGDLASYDPYSNQFMELTAENYFIGEKAGSSMTTGIGNSFMGYHSGSKTTAGSANVFVGQYTGQQNTTGTGNIFIGTAAGQSNTTGNQNLFIGLNSGHANTTGTSNLFIGNSAGLVNSTGMGNLFLGHNAGSSNVDGSGNLYIGANTGMYNVSGHANTFLGSGSGRSNTTGSQNTFVGESSGNANQSGMFNTALGSTAASFLNEESHHNVFIGYSSGRSLQDSSSNNVFVGSGSGANLTRGNSNIMIGKYAGQLLNGENNIFIGDYTGAVIDADNNVIIGTYAGSQIDGGGNVFIGTGAGRYENGSNKLFISNNDGNSDYALIYGEFDNSLLKLNGTVKVRDLLKLKPRADAPASPEMGDVYFDSVTKKLMVYDGTAWQACW
ncbi:MAG: hypothetical protein A2Z69_01255 [Bacteroidetes bacterium RBG_13_44_24]|nr:MAG: hypothetical protein A2Z69_01255 [Bacteroidetes bacterium RBG_13_44_24]